MSVRGEILRLVWLLVLTLLLLTMAVISAFKQDVAFTVLWCSALLSMDLERIRKALEKRGQ